MSEYQEREICRVTIELWSTPYPLRTDYCIYVHNEIPLPSFFMKIVRLLYPVHIHTDPTSYLFQFGISSQSQGRAVTQRETRDTREEKACCVPCRLLLTRESLTPVNTQNGALSLLSLSACAWSVPSCLPMYRHPMQHSLSFPTPPPIQHYAHSTQPKAPKKNHLLGEPCPRAALGEPARYGTGVPTIATPKKELLALEGTSPVVQSR